MAENPMTQHQYILWMANVCGDSLPVGATADDLTTWARGKGMNPAGGWQLNAKLSKQVLAQTLVQLLNLAPRKGTFDAVRLLEREGIIIQSSAGDTITVKNFAHLIDSGFSSRVGPTDHPLGGPPGRDDDDSPPSPTNRPVTPPTPGGSVPPGPPPGVPPGQDNVNKDGRS